MRILIVASSLARGGAERAAANLSRGLAASHDVSVLAFHDRVDYACGGDLLRLGLPYDPEAGLLRKPGRFVRKFLGLRSALRRLKPDAVLSFADGPNIVLLANRLLGLQAPCAVNAQCAPLRGYGWLNRFIYEKLIRALYRRADAVVTLSEGVRGEMIERFGLPAGAVKVIYNSIDLDEIDSLAAEPVGDLPGGWEGPVILNAGRLVPQKNQDLLIRAFRAVRDRIDVRLAILGQGPLEEPLRRRAAALGLADDVWFLGWRSNPFKYMRRASLFVLSSDFEGLGNVIIEALACGCPVVSTGCPFGPDEVLAGGQGGAIVPVGDAEALSRAMAGILGDEAERLRLARRARERAEAFSLPRIAADFERLLGSIGPPDGSRR